MGESVIDTTALKTQAPDLLSVISPLVPLKKIGTSSGGEWSGPCPFCGGNDRFSVQPYHDEPRWLCRYCTDGKWKDIIDFIQRRDNTGFVDACQTLFGDDVKIAVDPLEYERIQTEREQTIREQEAATLAGYEIKRQSLHDSMIWMEYHNNLDKLGGRELWHERGLNDYFIDV